MLNLLSAKPITIAFVGIILLMASALPADAFDNKNQDNSSFVIYLIRHAEKQVDMSDPQLTKCGFSRAQQYAEDFSAIPLDTIYSSDYQRTQQTAQPIAQHQQLSVVSYDPQQLNEIAQTLLAKKQSALVVGHSNTTAVLAGILTDQKLTEFSEKEYDRVYKVKIDGDQRTLSLGRQKFTCNESL